MKRAITKDLYDALLVSFRECPENYNRAAKQAGCCLKTAQKAWALGWAPRLSWAVPIKVMLLHEQEQARALARTLSQEKATLASDEREKARKDAVEGRAARVKMLAMIRQGIIHSSAAALELLPTIRRMCIAVARRADGIIQKLEDPSEPVTLLTLNQMLSTLRGCLYIMSMLSSSAHTFITAENLEAGKPTEILGLANLPDMSMEEAERKIAAAQSALERAKDRGLLPDGVLPGSKLTN